MIDEVKSYLKITWDDEDSEIQNLVDRGKSRLKSLSGAELEFETEGLARELLFEFCRYSYNNAVEYFEENFQQEILRLQLETGVNDYITALTGINIENVTLKPEFEPVITDYTAEVDSEPSNIEAVSREPDANISIEINGETLENDTEYSWNAGENSIKITVENNDYSKVYTVVVNYED